MKDYNPKAIEPKWQKYWEEQGTFVTPEHSDKEKFYALIEFPYPSGAGLHVGHPRPFTAMDVVSRMKRMQGYNVLYPIGFDAFGLPTENYAIKTGRPPAEVTAENIANFTRQLKMLGYSFDWSRAVDTTDPEYYKWTQWIFLQLYKHGLAYKKNMSINWCLSCKIGLANEEVVDGNCERCCAGVEKRDKDQWMLAITKYADKLLKGLETVDYIPQAKIQQENWIGRSEGAEVEFRIQNSEFRINVFTTRPDTLFGATYMVLAPEHELVTDLKFEISNWDEVEKYIKKASNKSDLERAELQKEKTGVELQGVKAVNPVNGEAIPVWIADYVLASYGTGAIMAVPGHDERDFEFAKKFNLQIKDVVAAQVNDRLDSAVTRNAVYGVCIKDGKLLTVYNKIENEYQLPGGGIDEGETERDGLAREVIEETGYTNFEIGNYYGTFEFNFHFPRKGINRHSYNSVHAFSLKDDTMQKRSKKEDEKLTVEWVNLKDVEKVFQGKLWGEILREAMSRAKKEEEEAYTQHGIAINSDFINGLSTAEAKEKMMEWLEEKGVGERKVQFKLRDWVFSRQRYWGEPIPLVKCESCADWIPLPESELPLTLPQVEKYEPTDTGESPLATMEEWVKTTCPKCGGEARRETDTMPNWAGSSWYFLRYLDVNNSEEFASMDKLKEWMPVDWYNGGMEHTVLHLLYSRFWNQFLYDIGVVPTSEPYQKRTSHGMILARDGQKMSKSLGNVVNPDDMVEQFGADALRTYIMFMGPFDQTVAWDVHGLIGVRRFLERTWRLQDKLASTSGNKKLVPAGHPSSGKIGNKDVEKVLHKTVKKVTEDIEAMRFNTAVSAMMELSNAFTKEESISKEQFEIFLGLLSPFAPHIAEELWSMLGHTESITLAVWPTFDPAKIVEDTVTIAVQVNGKLRATIEVPADISEDDVKARALGNENVGKWLGDAEPKKVIYVKGRLVSIVR